MNKEKFKKICKENNLNYENIKYNLNYGIKDLRLYKNKIFRPMFYISGMPKYEYIAKYQINLKDYE